MVPKHTFPASAWPRSPSTWSSIQRSFVALKYGSSTSPVVSRTRVSSPRALSSAHMSAVRRSCQTIARSTGSPVARFHTAVVSR